MRETELLIPAGSLDVLKTAVIYGADAVYLAERPSASEPKPEILRMMRFGRESPLPMSMV